MSQTLAGFEVHCVPCDSMQHDQHILLWHIAVLADLPFQSNHNISSATYSATIYRFKSSQEGHSHLMQPGLIPIIPIGQLVYYKEKKCLHT